MEGMQGPGGVEDPVDLAVSEDTPLAMIQRMITLVWMEGAVMGETEPAAD